MKRFLSDPQISILLPCKITKNTRIQCDSEFKYLKRHAPPAHPSQRNSLRLQQSKSEGFEISQEKKLGMLEIKGKMDSRH